MTVECQDNVVLYGSTMLLFIIAECCALQQQNDVLYDSRVLSFMVEFGTLWQPNAVPYGIRTLSILVTERRAL